MHIATVSDMRAWACGFAMGLRAPRAVALHGDLGMGKTEIARAIIQTLCGSDTVVPSPTFTLVQSYDAKSGGDATPRISHFDLYRITDASELEEIGLSHACANDITLIEWPEIAESMLPRDTVHIYITAEGEGRKIEIKE
ncbi:MAG: tRNA (adenosine(37)-N6)-threonylcarbamoyltransferase complex ATPase subunit type 1 TsaE [Rickettsiales bacterium]|jgi:tRNA threonylcarbamoyl adenosine modification protein YjeE|nr:tRNA (adenosine(37)-N6)-threonylcarbamoyltransferase complex ATPase subunit type 1 TsaE [Rickettsiales bacterium]